MRIKKTFQGNLPENTVANSQSNSQTNAYSCDYINTQLNGKQNKIKTMTLTLTTDSAGNAILNYMRTTDYIVLSIYQKSGTSANAWATLYTYDSYYFLHLGTWNGTAVSTTGTFEIVYIER